MIVTGFTFRLFRVKPIGIEPHPKWYYKKLIRNTCTRDGF